MVHPLWLWLNLVLFCAHRILSEVVANFPNSLDEVTVTAEPSALRLKNYVDNFEGIAMSPLIESVV